MPRLAAGLSRNHPPRCLLCAHSKSINLRRITDEAEAPVFTGSLALIFGDTAWLFMRPLFLFGLLVVGAAAYAYLRD